MSTTATAPRPLLRGWLHAMMVPLALAGGWMLAASVTEGTAYRASVIVFGVCLVGLYATSSLYHVPPWPARVRAWLGRCDTAMIQLFIAATFTPIAYHALSGPWRTWSLAVAWVIAVGGAAVAISPLEAPRWLTALGYVAFGWLAVVPLVRMMSALPWEGISLIALGGALYTIGAIVYARQWPDPFPRWFGFHEIFHLFVVAASTAHYLAIWRYVLPLGG
jgi:hemolysin III